MATTNKRFYEAPEMRVFEMKTQGVICTSGETDPFTVYSTSYGEGAFGA